MVFVEFKFVFLKVLMDHEHFVPLNTPALADPSAILHKLLSSDKEKDGSSSGKAGNNSSNGWLPSEIQHEFWQHHFLAGLLLHEISVCLAQKESEIRTKAIQALLFILRKHDFDPRYTSNTTVSNATSSSNSATPSKRRSTVVASSTGESITAMYFPFLLLVIENHHIILNKTSSHERKLWLICFLWIVKGLSKAVLRGWWRRATQQQQLEFIHILGIVLQLFEYQGKQKIAEDASAMFFGTGSSASPGALSSTIGGSGDQAYYPTFSFDGAKRMPGDAINNEDGDDSSSVVADEDQLQQNDDGYDNSSKKEKKEKKEKKSAKDGSGATLHHSKQTTRSHRVGSKAAPMMVPRSDTKELLENFYQRTASGADPRQAVGSVLLGTSAVASSSSSGAGSSNSGAAAGGDGQPQQLGQPELQSQQPQLRAWAAKVESGNLISANTAGSSNASAPGSPSIVVTAPSTSSGSTVKDKKSAYNNTVRHGHHHHHHQHSSSNNNQGSLSGSSAAGALSASSAGSALSLVAQIVWQQQNLSQEISLIVLKVIHDFVEDFEDEMLQRQSIFFSPLLTNIFIAALRTNQSATIEAILFTNLSIVLHDFRRYQQPLHTYKH